MDAIVTTVVGFFTDIQDAVTTSLVPALFALVMVGIIVGLGIKYLRKGARQV